MSNADEPASAASPAFSDESVFADKLANAARAYAINLFCVVSPIPRAGLFTIRRKAISSRPFAMSAKRASASLISSRS